MAEFKYPPQGTIAGTVIGPGSSTDNAVARFNGTTGENIQNSGVILDDSDNLSGVADLSASTITIPGGDVQTQIDTKVGGPASSTDNAIMRWDGTDGRVSQDSVVAISDTGVMTGATIDGDNNTIQDLALSSMKTVLGDATEVLRRDSTGAVVSGPMTTTDAGDVNGIKTIDLRNDDDLSGGTQWMIRAENRNDAAGSHPHLEFRRGRGSNADLQNGDDIGGLDFHPRHNGTNLSAAKIDAEYTGDGTTRKADIVIYTSNDAAPAERMRIQADGKVIVAGDFEVSGTTTTINTQTLEVEDKNITVNHGGTDASAAGAGLTVEGTGATTLATIQYDSSMTSKFKLGASGSEDEVLTRTATQTVTGKTIAGANNTLDVRIASDVTGLGTGVAAFLATPSSANLRTAMTDEVGTGSLVFSDSPILDAPNIDNGSIWEQISTPSNPAAGYSKLYPKTDGKYYTKDSSGVEAQLVTTADALTNPMTTTGDTIYGGASGVATRLAGDTTNTKKWLRSLSTGGTAAAPTWEEVDQVKGRTDGAAVSAGYVGEVFSQSTSSNLSQGSPSAGTYYDVGLTISSVTAGNYRVDANIIAATTGLAGSDNRLIGFRIVDTGGSSLSEIGSIQVTANGQQYATGVLVGAFRLSGTTDVKLQFRVVSGVGSGTATAIQVRGDYALCNLIVTRIA